MNKILVNTPSTLSSLCGCQNLVLLQNVDQKSVFIVCSQHVLKNQVARMLEQSHGDHCSFPFNHHHQVQKYLLYNLDIIKDTPSYVAITITGHFAHVFMMNVYRHICLFVFLFPCGCAMCMGPHCWALVHFVKSIRAYNVK